MPMTNHNDDYSDLLSAQERAEIEAKRTSLEEQKSLRDEPQPLTLAEAAQEVLANFVKPFKPYLRYHELGRAPTAENDTSDFLEQCRAFTYTAAGAITPQNIAQPGGVTAMGGPGAAAGADVSAAGVQMSPDEMRRLLPLIRQIAREEIKRHEQEQYRRMRFPFERGDRNTNGHSKQ